MSTYTPKPGSKIAAGLAAMEDGPMTTAQLGKAMDCNSAAVGAMLAAAVEHGTVLKLKDESGLLHFGLGGRAVDERFNLYGTGRQLTDVPFVRTVKNGPVPTAEALAFAHPFRKPSPEASGETSAIKPDQDETATPAKREPTQPTAAVEEFVAGLFSNGELHITASGQTIRLNRAHTRQLCNYLDKVLNALAEVQ